MESSVRTNPPCAKRPHESTLADGGSAKICYAARHAISSCVPASLYGGRLFCGQLIGAMSECACPHCRPHDPDYRYTEAHRLDCEARKVIEWTLQQRREYLDNVERMRGKTMRTKLEEAIRKNWPSRQKTSNASGA